MKQLIESFLELIGRIIGFLTPRSLNRVYGFLCNHIYTGYFRSRFYCFGSSVFIGRPLHLEGEKYIVIGNDNVFESDLQLTAWSENNNNKSPIIKIGDKCLFRKGCHITAINGITIGNNLLTGTNVLITDNSHGDNTADSQSIPPRQRALCSKGPVVIGNDVWLGNNVCIMPGVTIGDGAIVGANAVVTRDVPAQTVVAGIPAQVISSRRTVR
ncbi:MAG: acyltransferase [Bacteroidaceae bacterium]|nr:acyltransferase [Bacteroidaceae bacterium]